MVSDIVSLSAERAKLSRNAQDWSPRDCLEEAIRQIENKEIDAAKMVICIQTRPTGQGFDRVVEHYYFSAGTTNTETIGLLQQIMHSACSNE